MMLMALCECYFLWTLDFGFPEMWVKVNFCFLPNCYFSFLLLQKKETPAFNPKSPQFCATTCSYLLSLSHGALLNEAL